MNQSFHKSRPYPLRFFHSAVTGQILCALSIVCMLQANIGSSPWTVFQQGLTNMIPISFGTANVLVNVAIISAAFLLGEKLGFGSLFCVFLPGPCIDVIQHFHLVPLQHSLLGGILMMLLGLELLALSTYVYMKEGLGSGPRDALMVALAKKSGKSAGFCRICLDTGAITLGWLMGGVVGIGTVISMVGIGALIDCNFALFRFDPTALHQEHCRETIQNMARR